MPNTYSMAIAMHDLGGNFLENIFMYSLSESGTASPFEYADALITAFRLTNQASYLDLLGNDITVDFASAKRVTGTGGPSATQIVVDTGTGVAVSGASGLCADIQWQTLAATNRPGHTFIGCFPSTVFTSGFFSAGYQTTVATFVTSMLTPLTLAGGLGTADFGILTRKGKIFNEAKQGKLLPKPTMLNKRTVPIL